MQEFDRIEAVQVADPRFSTVSSIRGAAYSAKAGAIQGLPAIGQDEFDSVSTSFLAFSGGDAVATWRICFAPEVFRTDYHDYGLSRAGLPPLEEAITISRLAVLPGMQARGFATTAIKSWPPTALAVGRRWLIAGASESLLRAYVKRGLAETGEWYMSRFGSPHQFLTMDCLMYGNNS